MGNKQGKFGLNQTKINHIGGASSLVNEIRFNALPTFMYRAGLLYPGSVSNYQDQSGQGLYSPVGDGKREYLEQVLTK